LSGPYRLINKKTGGCESDWRREPKVCKVEMGGPVGIKRSNLTGRNRGAARAGWVARLGREALGSYGRPWRDLEGVARSGHCLQRLTFFVEGFVGVSGRRR
jgi:hypothetical protein